MLRAPIFEPITATDPRLSGTHYYIWAANTYSLTPGGSGPHAFADAMRIENEEGAWQGSAQGIELADGTTQHSPFVLTGEGAYAGLTAILLDVEGSCFFSYRGVVMEMPDRPVPDTGD